MKLLFFLFIFIPFSLFGQLSENSKQILEPIYNYNFFCEPYQEIELDSIKNNLIQNASDEELLYLTKEEKSVYVNALAFQVLNERKGENFYEAFSELLKRPTQKKIEFNCTIDSYSLPGYLIENIYTTTSLTDYKMERLFEIVFDSKPLNIELLKEVYSLIPPKKEFYKPLRKAVEKTRSEKLLVALAKFENKKDIPLIKSFGSKAFEAINFFPDEAFIPLFERSSFESDSLQYLFPLRNYCDKRTTALLEKVVNDEIANLKEDERSKNSYLVMTYSLMNVKQCEINYPILYKIWLSNKIISYDVLEHFELNHTGNETREFLLQGFLSDGDLKFITAITPFDENTPEDIRKLEYSEEKQYIYLLNKLRNYSEADYEKALYQSLLDIDDLAFDNFIYELDDNENIVKNTQAILTKMKNNDTAYGLLVIMNGVKLLNNQELFEAGFEIIKQRREEFKDKNIWEKSLQEFVKENNLKL